MNFNNPEDLIGYFDTLKVYLDLDDHDFVDQEDHKDDGWKFSSSKHCNNSYNP